MLDAFDISKNDSYTAQMAWLREIPFISYGYVKEVIDGSTVRVRPVVQRKDRGVITEMDVTLLSISSGAFELSVHPQEGDLVLLLSLDKIHPDMFNPITTRLNDEDGEPVEDSEETEDTAVLDALDVLNDDAAIGYTYNSLVGILATTMKRVAGFKLSVSGELATLSSEVPFIAQLTKGVYINVSSADDGEYAVSLRIGQSHPSNVEVESPTTIRFGFHHNGEEDEPVDAPLLIQLSESAPLSVESESAIDITSSEAISVNSAATISLVSEEEIQILAGKVLEIILDGSDAIKIGNQINTLGGLLGKYNDILTNFDTVGSPASHLTGPGAKAQLAALKAEQDKVFG